MPNESIGYLFFMQIPFGGKIVVKTKGPKAKTLQNEIVKTIR